MSTKKTLLQLSSLLLWITAFTFAAELPQLFSNTDGFADATLSAQKIERLGDGSILITAAAQAEKETVGFRVILPSQWEAWKPQGFPGTLLRGIVKIESTGKETEAFVRALAKAYKTKLERYQFKQGTLTAIALQGDPKKADMLPVKLKVFNEGPTQNEYAELFLNFDLPRRIVQFHEKDPEYRKAVIGFFTRKSGS